MSQMVLEKVLVSYLSQPNTWADPEVGTGGPDTSWKFTSGYYGFLRNSGMDLLEKQFDLLSPIAFRRRSVQPPVKYKKKTHQKGQMKFSGSAHVISPLCEKLFQKEL